jgi:hypothetical protein
MRQRERVCQCVSVCVCVCAGVTGYKKQDVQYKLQGSGLESPLNKDIRSLLWYAIWTQIARTCKSN